jgi:hypothetical protein
MLDRNHYNYSGGECGGHVKVVVARKSNAMDASLHALNVQDLVLSVLGSKQRIGPP